MDRTSSGFAAEDTPAPLRRGFDALRAVCTDETTTELIWSSLHGVVTLRRGGRIPPEHVPALLDRLGRLESYGLEERNPTR